MAVCLNGGTAHAVNGMVSASNGTSSFSVTSFSTLSTFKLFGSKVSVQLSYAGFSTAYLKSAGGTVRFNSSFNNVYVHSAGFTVTGGLSMGSSVINEIYVGDKYYAMSFQDSGTKLGWVHVVQTNAEGTLLVIDQWSYNGSGGTIKTLSDSVTTSRLALTGGQEKLYWSNDNEDGVARYEVQSRDASGAWQAADSDVPGSGSYSAKVDSGKTCRLVVEMTDGSTKKVDF
jgi:hypothetical protein